MPEQFWTCAQCGELNPAFTEVCRNCYAQPDFASGQSTPTIASRPPEKTAVETNSKLVRFLYGFALGYAVISCVIRESGVILLTAIGLGLPVIAILAIEWIVPPLLAVFFGFQARWSLNKAVSGAPLVFLYSVVSPTIHGKNVVLPALMPWLAAFPASTTETLPTIGERLLWWGGMFVLAVMSGRLSRIIRSPFTGPHSRGDS